MKLNKGIPHPTWNSKAYACPCCNECSFYDVLWLSRDPYTNKLHYLTERRCSNSHEEIRDSELVPILIEEWDSPLS